MANETMLSAVQTIAIKSERNASEQFERLAGLAIQAAIPIIHWGDGSGGYLIERFSELVWQVAPKPLPQEVTRSKQEIPAKLRISVFERDAYRCVTCGGWHDLTCDHKYPESLGGETTLDNLQTMCRSCNSSKATKLPDHAAKAVN